MTIFTNEGLGYTFHMKKYNKLVRDKIPEIMKEKGLRFKTHIAGDGEYYDKLKEKLLEEVGEFLQDDSVEELADVQEVLKAILVCKNIKEKKLETIRVEKENKRGAFKKRIILEEGE